jgi:hypothetical protein
MVAAIILLCLLSGKFFVHGIKHGEPSKGKYNLWGAIFYIAVQLTLYYYAGLFDKF